MSNQGIVRRRIFPVLFMLVLTLIFISVTTVIYTLTKDTIKFNESLRLKKAVLYTAGISVPEGAEKLEDIYLKRVKEVKDREGNLKYYIVQEDDTSTVKSYVIIYTGPGLWGEIKVTVGYDREIRSITGIEIIDQNETPGLGGRISEIWFKEQFRGKQGPLESVSEGTITDENQFQAITGATYSSNAIMDILNATTDVARSIINKEQE